MHTAEFHSYHTVILLSDLDSVALNDEHIFLMRWNQTRVNSRRDGSIVYHQHKHTYGLCCRSIIH